RGQLVRRRELALQAHLRGQQDRPERGLRRPARGDLALHARVVRYEPRRVRLRSGSVRPAVHAPLKSLSSLRPGMARLLDSLAAREADYAEHARETWPSDCTSCPYIDRSCWTGCCCTSACRPTRKSSST